MNNDWIYNDGEGEPCGDPDWQYITNDTEDSDKETL